MISGFQCICGIYVVIRGEAPGRVPCPNCGTEFSENSVTLHDGTTYRLEENGRWIREADEPKHPPIPIPVSRFFGERNEC